MDKYVHWTESELQQLVELYPTMKAADVAQAMGRSLSAVRDKAYTLGLKSGRTWTPEEYEYLDENWGKTSLGSIAKHLARSEDAVKIKVVKRSLGAFLDAGDYVSFNQLMTALGRGQSYSYQMISWVEVRGMPVKTKRVKDCTFRVVYLDDFWKWAEKNRTFIDFSKVEKNILGKEPAWVKEQRKADILRVGKYRSPKEPWTPMEDSRLKDYLKQHRYTYHELSQMMGRTCGAIQRRVLDLGIKERPVKADNHVEWTQEEFGRFADMIKSGMSYDLMAEELGRSSKALRGRTWQVYRTENLDKIIAMMGAGGWGDGTPEPTVKYDFRRVAVKQDLARLCGLLSSRRRQLATELQPWDDYWQKDMCSHWDSVKGCLAGETDCDSCACMLRIREAG